ncbi:MAG: putative porin [Desulfobacterales bacterium]
MLQKMMTGFFVFLLGLFLSLPMTASADVNASDFIAGVDLKGDLRVRYDWQDDDDGKDSAKDRLRARFRLGFVWHNPDESWKVAAGLATGDLDGATTNATYSETEVFETGDIRLDYAYAEHNINKFTLTAGQHINKFHSTMALWDPDVRPAGFTAQVNLDPAFITAGYFQVGYVDRAIASMAAIQAGVNVKNLLMAAAYYDVNHVKEFLEVDIMDPDYKYQIVDFYTKYDLKLDKATISPHAQVFYNVGAKGNAGQSVLGGTLDPEDENLGWLVGVKAKVDKFGFGVEYGQVGADAAVQDIKDSDWGSSLKSTDIKGWKAGAGYSITKNCGVSVTGYYTEPLERENYAVKDVKRAQVDLSYKF